MFRRLVVLAAFLFVLSGHLAAQDSAAILTGPGRLIRVRLDGQEPYVGTLLRLDNDTLVMVRDGLDTVRVRTRSISRFEVYAGEYHNVGGSAARGAMIGGGVGLALAGLAAASQDEGDWTYVPPGQLIASGVLGGAVWGAAIGTVVGLIHRSPKWERTPVPTVVVHPASHGVAVGLRLRF